MGRRGAERPSQAQRPLKPGPTGRRRMACGQSPPEIALSQCGRPYASLLWPEPAGNSRPHSPRSFDLPYPPCFEPPDCPQTPTVSQISPQHTPLASLDGGFGLNLAFEQVHGVPDAFDHIAFTGGMDLPLMTEVYGKWGLMSGGLDAPPQRWSGNGFHQDRKTHTG